MNTEIEYGALLIDTSIFDGNGLRLEKGLLGKLKQFRKSPIDLLMPDVIFNEIKTHLEQKIKASRSALEKSLNDAGDHLFFDGSTLNDAKKILIDSKEIENLAETRLDNFLNETGATPLECGEYVTVSVLLKQYFSNQPPFAETGKKKNEFPDAIILMAIEEWAERMDKSVLAIAKDDDWKRYCETSKRINYEEELSAGLAVFNEANAPYALLANLEHALESGDAKSFLDDLETRLNSALSGFTPDQDADSFFYWEPNGCDAWFKKFHLSDHEFRVIESDEDWVVLEANAVITVEAEGEFSLSVHDSIDRDYVHMGSVSAIAEKEFESEILITISGDLNGPIDGLTIEDVEIVSLPKTIDFGSLEIDYGEYD